MKTKQIYILFSDTGTLLSKLIKWYTKKPLNHTSLVLDPDLQLVYSFGRKFQNNPLQGGFVKENMHGELFVNSETPTPCALYSCSVHPAVYERVKQQLLDMENNQHKYTYNLIGLFTLIFKIHFAPKNSYFCSQFIAAVLAQNGMQLVNKPSEFVTPGDLAESSLVSCIYEGNLQEYLSNLKRQTSGRIA
ncbi:hypothetical protein D3C73_539750 [compost metagenome]